MTRSQRIYNHEYKVQAVKLAKEIGGAKAAKESGIPEGTNHTWFQAVRTGQLDIGEGYHTPESAMSLAEGLTILRKRVKDQDAFFTIFIYYRYLIFRQYCDDFS